MLAVLERVKATWHGVAVTQRHPSVVDPSDNVARRIRELRTRRGWSAERLAKACADVGRPELNRSVIANIESRRRREVTLEEAVTLAYVLDVAPVHLMVPVDDAELYLGTPDPLPNPAARAWIRGEWCPPGCDPRVYFSEVPAEEFRPERPSSDTIAAHGEQVQYRRDLDAEVETAEERRRQ
jgi:transcriptional regulator with XRE-family HTH domain